MLGDINPQTVRIVQQAVVYPGHNHVTSLNIKRYDGRSYKPVDLNDLTRVVLAFPGADPAIVFDSDTQAVFTWSGNVLTVDLSDYAMPESIEPSYLIVYDLEHPLGQVLVDDVDTRLEFDFRLVPSTGTTPPPSTNLLTDAPADGDTYGRKDGAWVSLAALVSGVSSVNGQSGTVVLTTDNVPEGATNLYHTTARAAAAAPVQSVNSQTGAVTLNAASVAADPTGTAAGLLTAHEADTTPHANLMNVTKVGFNTAAGSTADNPGEMVWNDLDKTLDIGVGGGVVLQAGQEVLVLVLNNTGAPLVDGDVVYITGASGNRVTVAKAIASAASAHAGKTLAMVTQTIANNQQGLATIVGLVRGFNTSGFAEGAELWLSPTVAGGLTQVRPAAPNKVVRIGYVSRSHATQGIIFVRIQIVESVDDLSDVVLTSVQDGDVLEYDSATSTWVNRPNTGGSGEANTASNLGAGNGLFAQKVGVDLQFKSLVAGSGVTITPAESTLTITAAGGSGAVDSVNGQTGVVVLDTDDINEGATNLYFTNARASAAAPVQSVDGQTGVVNLSSVYTPASHVGDTGAAHGVATTSVAGFMSAADKTKLAGIAAGATANTNTDSLSEGSTNLYHTAARVLATALSGLSLATGGAITSADTVLVAFGKLQKQITDLITTVGAKQDKATLVTEVGASRTLLLTDAGKYLRFTSTSSKTCTVPPQVSVAWADDTEVHIRNAATSNLTLTPGSGVALTAPYNGTLVVPPQGTVTLKRTAEDTWDVMGVTI